MDEQVRDCDKVYKDNLLSSSVSSNISQNFLHQDIDDVEMNEAIEESIRLYEMEQKIIIQKARLDEERQQKQAEIRRKEEKRVEELRARLGIIVSRLKTIFADDAIAKDLAVCIEWECTPNHLLMVYKPNTQFSMTQIREWATKNLNPKMNELLSTLSFYSFF